MTQRNKIVLKRLIPFTVSIGTMAAALLSVAVWINKNPESFKQTHPTEQNPVLVFNISCIGLIVCLVLGSIPVYKRANDFAAVSVQNYLKKLIAKNPELAKYKSVLQNRESLQNIAAMISNELHDDEQKRILNAVKKINLDSSEMEIMKTHNEIAGIINEYATVHPEFLERVHVAITSADYAQYVKQIQHENAQRAKEKFK